MRNANYIVQDLSVLFEQAIDMGWITHNPARGIPLALFPGAGSVGRFTAARVNVAISLDPQQWRGLVDGTGRRYIVIA